MNQDLGRRMSGGIGRLGGKLALILIGLGFLAIGLGYNGASGDARVGAQMPYLISGLGLGLGLILVGTALMVVQTARENRAMLEAKLDAVAEALRGGTSYSEAGVPAGVEGLVVAGTASYHEQSCRLVDGREEVRYLTVEEAQAATLQPCRVCKPVGYALSSR